MKKPSIMLVVCLLVPNYMLAQNTTPDPGTRVILDRDNDGVRLLLDAPDEEENPEEGVSIGLRTRYVTVPDAFFESVFLEHTSLDSYSLGVEVGIDGPGSLRVIFGLDYTDLSMPSGNFRLGESTFSRSAENPEDANFTEINLHMVALDATFLWQVKFIETFGLMYGVGLGVAVLTGTIYATDVLPTCQQPVDQCPHWRGVTRQKQDLPSPVWPLLSAQVGLYWDPAPGWRIRLEGGFRGVLFTGVAARAAF
ncbi:MAG: hypothetical protein VX223_12460 [Myxococcota bacterium]|nr:hypothetical protein [Myxococcota bacterium]